MRAWSFYTNVQGNTYIGHDGYDELLGAIYSYDDGVANHLQVSVGDLLVLRGGSGSLGVAFVDSIVQRDARKLHRRCPNCNTAQIEERKTLHPRYRCTNGHSFSAFVVTEEEARIYRVEYDRSYLRTAEITAAELESLSVARSWQNAIRELDLGGTLALLRSRGIVPAFVAPASSDAT